MKKLNQSPRYTAIEVLCLWGKKYQPVDQVLDKYFSSITFADQRDRQLSISIIYGVIRWRGYLDWVIGEFSSHPPTKMKLRTLQTLRVGIFQLLFLDRIPASAAINETVQAFKDMKQPKWLAGFVNGLLRNIERQNQNIPTPLNKKPLPESALLSHPEWLIRRWKNRYGHELTHQICRKNNIEAPLCLRVNTSLTTAAILLKKFKKAGLQAESGKYSHLAVKLFDFRGLIINIPGFTEGLFQVQDEAAQLVGMMFGSLQKRKTYLDGCAGLGGKTSHLAEQLPPESKLVATDPSSGRLIKLRKNLDRLRLASSVTIVEDTVDSLLPEMKEKFAGILIDAPCSGLGVIRRHPDIRWNRIPEDLRHYQKIQSDILETAAQLLAPGGTLVYATCSTEPEENEMIIKKFLAESAVFKLSNCGTVLPKSASPFIDKMGFLKTIPGQGDLDGFFGARLIKMKN